MIRDYPHQIPMNHIRFCHRKQRHRWSRGIVCQIRLWCWWLGQCPENSILRRIPCHLDLRHSRYSQWANALAHLDLSRHMCIHPQSRSFRRDQTCSPEYYPRILRIRTDWLRFNILDFCADRTHCFLLNILPCSQRSLFGRSNYTPNITLQQYITLLEVLSGKGISCNYFECKKLNLIHSYGINNWISLGLVWNKMYWSTFSVDCMLILV